jgi:hypothetical protein
MTEINEETFTTIFTSEYFYKRLILTPLSYESNSRHTKLPCCVRACVCPFHFEPVDRFSFPVKRDAIAIGGHPNLLYVNFI